MLHSGEDIEFGCERMRNLPLRRLQEKQDFERSALDRMFVFPEIHMLKPKPQCDDIWK